MPFYSLNVIGFLSSIYLLTWPPRIASMLNIGGWSSLPREEANGTLGTVPNGLRAALYLPLARPLSKRLWLFYHIISSPSSFPTLLSFSLFLRFFLLPPLLHAPPLSPGYPGRDAPNIYWIVTFLDSAPPPDKIP